METESETKLPMLELAWTRYAHFDAVANEKNKSHMQFRRWIAALGVLATLFAILTQIMTTSSVEFFGKSVLALVLKMFFIATPIVASGLAAFTNWFFGKGDWLVMRAGAEEILKEMFVFRTVLQKSPDRRAWLEKRLTDIQRNVYRGLGGEMILKPYNGPIPPYDDPDDPTDDAGFSDLTGDQYFAFRVETQLAWHMKKVNKLQTERVRLQIYIILFGALGAILAAFGGLFGLWVAFTASIVAALVGWQELRNLDAIIKNYSKVQLELLVIYDHWNNLTPAERTDSEFYNMVRSTEDLLWSQNAEYIKSMQEALKSIDQEEAELVNQLIKKSVEEDARFKQGIRDVIVEETTSTMRKSQDTLIETYRESFGSLAEEAASPLVQAELEAMQQAAAQAVETVIQGASQFASKLQSIAEEYKGVKINQETPASLLHEMIGKFPTTEEVKG
jgi:uncharacterized membrane protein HdeD (DUF308 family)